MESLQIFRNLIPMQVIIEIHVYLLSKIKQNTRSFYKQHVC